MEKRRLIIMPFPLIPIAIGLAAGAGGFSLGSILGGGSKKKAAMGTTYYPYATYSPIYSPVKNVQLDYYYAPSAIIESPMAKGATITSKKEASLVSEPYISTAQSPYIMQADQGTGSLMTIAVIGGIALLGIYFLSKNKS